MCIRDRYWDGIKLAIKFVEADAIIMKIKTKLVNNKLFSLPIISVGLVSIFSTFSGLCFKKASTPITIKSPKKEKINHNRICFFFSRN